MLDPNTALKLHLASGDIYTGMDIIVAQQSAHYIFSALQQSAHYILSYACELQVSYVLDYIC